jgi:DNA transformation protein and related proteins
VGYRQIVKINYVLMKTMKVKSTLTGRINIGKDTEAKLIQAGIDSFEKLKELGSEQAFLRLQAFDPGACLSLLYGLEGAIENVKYNELSAEKKQYLILFHKQSQRKLHEQ